MTFRATATGLAALALVAAAGQTTRSGAVFTAQTTNPQSVVRSAADWTPPVVALADPGSPLRGTVTLTATATDARSGIAAVRIQRAPAGSGAWTDVCTDQTSPYTCSWNTAAVADGFYDLRAVATDGAGIEGVSAIVAGRIVDTTGPVVEVLDPGTALRGVATIRVAASDAGTGVAAVRLQRAVAGGTSWTDICTDTAAPYECAWTTTAVTDGAYDLRAIATDKAGSSTTSALLEDVEVDNTAPSITMVNPGSPLSGTVTLGSSSDDGDGSGVVEVLFQRQGLLGGAWTDICTAVAEPFSCRWQTPTAGDGVYNLRAIATDAAGNSRTSATIGARQVANTLVNTVSLEDPPAVLRGTVELAADANATLGVASVAIQVRRAGTSAWAAVCTDTSSPYTCDFATVAVPDGTYELRAVMTSNLGTSTTSAVLTRVVDNAPVRGRDVQAVNTNSAGRLVSGDQLVLTFTRPMNPATLIAGWTGAAPAATTVRLVDAGTSDRLELAPGLGTVVLNANRIRKNKTTTFAATAVLTADADGGSVVTITLGNIASGNGRQTGSVPATMSWTPSATARDLAGVPSSSAAVAETGPLDLDF